MKRYVFSAVIVMIFAVAANSQSVSDKLDTVNINNVDRWFAADKAHHFALSAYLTAVNFYLAKKELNMPGSPALTVSVGVSFSLGVVKEVYDGKLRKTKFSFKDLVADCSGIGAGLIIIGKIK